MVASTRASATLTPGRTASPAPTPATTVSGNAIASNRSRDSVFAAQRRDRDPRGVGEQNQGQGDLSQQLDLLAAHRRG